MAPPPAIEPDRLTWRVRTAHGDAWQAEGRLRTASGGGSKEIRGARLMASGLATPKWNNADIVGEDVDVEAMLAWYRERDVPWGIRVPLEVPFSLGEPLFRKRCAGLVPEMFRPAPDVSGATVRQAGPADLAPYAGVELARFGGDAELELRWLKPALGAPDFSHWLAEAEGAAVGVAMTVLTDDRAGRAAYLAGVAVVPGWASRGLEPKLASTAIEAAFEAEATLVHLNPDDDEVAWAHGLGFMEVPGFQVHLVRSE